MIAGITLPESAGAERLSPETASTSGLRVEPVAGANFVRETVKLINETSVSELESKLPDVIQRFNQNAFVVGGILEKIRREKFWNPGSKHPKNALFERWVEKTCHYSGRKARYLISVYVGIVNAALPSSKMMDIGWSKLRLIAPLLRPVNCSDARRVLENSAHNAELVGLARRISRRELETRLRSRLQDKALGADRRAACKATRLVFEVREDEAHLVGAALDKIATETGHTGAEALVDMACAIETRIRVPTLEYFMKRAGRDAAFGAYVKLFGRPSEQ